MEGGSLTRDSEEKIKKRDLKLPCEWISLYIGALFGNLEGVHLPGHLSEKDGISGFFSWTQRTMRF
jgi:hypothetical protein